MATDFGDRPREVLRRYSGWGVAGLALGFLGLVFFWVVPLGLIFSVAGVILGAIGSLVAFSRHGPGVRLSIGATAFSLAVLLLNVIIDLFATGHGFHSLFSY